MKDPRCEKVTLGNSIEWLTYEFVHSPQVSKISNKQLGGFLGVSIPDQDKAEMGEDIDTAGLYGDYGDEDLFQNAAKRLLMEYGLLDSHAKYWNALVPILTQSRLADGDELAFGTRSDFFVSSFPGVLELKLDEVKETDEISSIDCQGLGRCLERVIPLIYRQGHLRRIVSFVMTSRRIWILSACASEKYPGEWHLQINLLEPKQVIPVLKALKRASADPSWFISEEGFVLLKIPQIYFHSEIPLAFFHVRWIASSSQASVFCLSCPKKENSLWTVTDPENDQTSQSVVVKVVLEQRNLKAEIAALSAMADTIINNPTVAILWWSVEFYALAAFTPKDGLVQFKTTKFLPCFNGLRDWKTPEKKSGWWDLQSQEFPSGAGAIFMNNGTECEKVSPSDIMAGVCRSLFALHQSGYVHRDIRFPNILKFGDQIQLIDYGFAREQGDYSADGLFERMINRSQVVFRQLSANYARNLQWYPTTDHEMLIWLLINRDTPSLYD